MSPEKTLETVDLFDQARTEMEAKSGRELLGIVHGAEFTFQQTPLAFDVVSNRELCRTVAAAFVLMTRYLARTLQLVEEDARSEATHLLGNASELFGKTCRLAYGIGRDYPRPGKGGR